MPRRADAYWIAEIRQIGKHTYRIDPKRVNFPDPQNPGIIPARFARSYFGARRKARRWVRQLDRDLRVQRRGVLTTVDA